MKILISAFAFSPYRGSECAVGWNIVNELSKHHDVTVLCGDLCGEECTKKELARYYVEEGHCKPDRLDIEYVAPSRLIAVLERIHRLPCLWGLYYWAYNLWQRLAYKRAKELLARESYDIVHQLNMIGYREPGYLWKLPVPFIWGPVGGAPNEPIAFHRMFSWSGCVKVIMRSMLNEFQKRICARPKLATRAAKKIWVVTDADYKMVHNLWGGECEKMVETGTALRAVGKVRSWDGKSKLRIVWSGIHTSRKALPVLLYALSRLEGADYQCDILGAGPETNSWKALSAKLGISNRLVWHGKLSHEDALRVMDSGHVFAFPSLKEGTPHVVLEALSLGLPVICHEACGMGVVVTEQCGFKVRLQSPEISIEGFAKTLMMILNDPAIVAEKSAASIERAKTLSWTNKVMRISKAYEEVICRPR